MAFSLFGSAVKSPEEKFWTWFEKNQNSLFNFEQERDRNFRLLAKEMKKINSNLTFEFGPIFNNGKREFVISAGGISEAFPKVESLFAAAPELDKWIFIKYRPRRDLMPIEFGNEKIRPEDIKCQVFEDNDKIGILLFFEDYCDEKLELFGHIGFLMLDQALGEYDVATKVGFVEFAATDSEFYKYAHPITELRNCFDNYFGR
ncbi:MAG: hypothetical protein JSU85_09840 [Candidatus Zixiibacteriota bacterium]|nr:MAG: hypothetical protein JSU85_09840 [candidate division Zixibacteria bacterium]